MEFFLIAVWPWLNSLTKIFAIQFFFIISNPDSIKFSWHLNFFCEKILFYFQILLLLILLFIMLWKQWSNIYYFIYIYNILLLKGGGIVEKSPLRRWEAANKIL